jgi:uncharacterized protein YhbP (UPF0306 family)
MPAGARAAALSYLRAHNVMTLATSGTQGLWAAAVFYASDGFDLVFLSAGATRHGLNIGAAAAVAATVQEDYSDWRDIRGVQLEGEARRLAGEDASVAADCYARKFPFVRDWREGPPPLAAALARISWYRLVPSRLYFIDNSRRFGHRDLVIPEGAG